MKSDTATESALAYTREELVAGIRAGNEWAWRAMTERYEPLLRWLARRYRLSAQDAEDAIQLTWLRCLEHNDQLTDADKLDGWLATICRRECIRLATKAQREMPLTELEMVRLVDDTPRAVRSVHRGRTPRPVRAAPRRHHGVACAAADGTG
jgi:DNA-directed RNA polymerase specialized sigma24 family protein